MSPCPPTAMITPVFVVACLALAGQASAGLLSVGTEPTKFIVTYKGLPNFETFGFFTMPRTVKEATRNSFLKVRGTRDGEMMDIYCRKWDYRVCVLFDLKGSVAGIQLSIKASEMEKFPVSAVGKPEWRRQTFDNQEVYTAVALFDSIDNINNGGRTMTSSTYTLPGNLYIQQSDANGKVTGYLEVSNKETGATLSGFKEQNCFIGMGKHYFQELTPSSTCEEQRPYFLLYSPKTKNLQGFGFSWFGTPTTDARNWFESPPALAAKMIAPHSPDCMTDYINKYGMFTMHVYFVEKPWLTLC